MAAAQVAERLRRRFIEHEDSITAVDLVDIFIKHIPLPGHVARLANGVLDLLQRQVMHGARRGDDVFLDHQAAHVVGAEQKASWPILSPCVTHDD